MYTPRFVLRSFDVLDANAKEAVLRHLLDALIATNVAYLDGRPNTPWLYESGVSFGDRSSPSGRPHIPRLYKSGVRYVEEKPGIEDWQDIPETIARRVGDCEDLACWRIAELRVRDGELAWPSLRRSTRGKQVLYHIAVKRPNGTLEDPSRLLGMGRT